MRYLPNQDPRVVLLASNPHCRNTCCISDLVVHKPFSNISVLNRGPHCSSNCWCPASCTLTVACLLGGGPASRLLYDAGRLHTACDDTAAAGRRMQDDEPADVVVAFMPCASTHPLAIFSLTVIGFSHRDSAERKALYLRWPYTCLSSCPMAVSSAATVLYSNGPESG